MSSNGSKLLDRIIRLEGQIYSRCNSGYYCVGEGLKTINPGRGEYIIQQFTGIQDNYGVDIYEGDILSNDDENWQVYFSNDNLAWYIGFGPDNVDCDEFLYEYVTINNKSLLKIVGNIIENPELFKDEEIEST